MTKILQHAAYVDRHRHRQGRFSHRRLRSVKAGSRSAERSGAGSGEGVQDTSAKRRRDGSVPQCTFCQPSASQAGP